MQDFLILQATNLAHSLVAEASRERTQEKCLTSMLNFVVLQVTYKQRLSQRMGVNIVNHWRKSSQWVALQRKHAVLIADDVDFDERFEKFCRSAFDADYNT